jgi:Na+/H+ antiporter NhaD/arsenite permease-like protein
VWAVVARYARGRWHWTDGPVPEVEAPPFNAWQTSKGLILLALLVAAFLVGPWPREVVALGVAGLLLASRHMASAAVLGLVDWHLLVLFAGLFVVNGAVQYCGLLDGMLEVLAGTGADVSHPAGLFLTAVLLSNVVSNVPAVMLLIPTAKHPMAGPILALASTLAGNLFIVGSIANIIVVDQAQRLGVRITWLEHARAGVPVTAATLLIAALWLWLLAR